jgi:tripartite ATP-independent transporter DctM subunit
VAIVTVAACTFFTSFTGASGVTILALGGLIMPLLKSAGYTEKDALGLITGAGSAGVVLLPALPLILYAIVARVSLESMFLGGLLPAALTAVLIIWWGVRRQPATGPSKHLRWDAVRSAVWSAKWELLLPAIPIAALASGLTTPTEAAALTALYAFIVVTILNRDLDVRQDLVRIVTECGLLVGGILMILGVALSFTNYMVDAGIPERLITLVTREIDSRWVFLLALNGFLLLLGCVMDIFSAIVIVAPLIAPLGAAFGVDPVHLGIIFLANLELGYLTPPVGMNLFFASYRFGASVLEVYRASCRLFIVLCVGVLLITYVPALTTVLPQLLR